jgi:Ca-activated chloride channel family protein
VLTSDGESNQGATADAFRAWYDRQPSSLRQVPVFTVLFGESATGQMKGLADLTHGRTFDARTQSLSAVFGENEGELKLPPSGGPAPPDFRTEPSG